MLSIPLVLLSTFGCLCTAATASITADLGASSSVLHFGNLSYYVSDDAVTTWHCSPFVGGSGTLTTFITDETNITAKVLTGLLEEYGEDDVWTPAFLKAVALKTPSDAILTLDGYDWLLSHKIKYLLPSKGMQIHAYLSKNLTIVPDISLDELQSGPYIVNNNGSHVTTHEVYRLFEDKYQAFTQGIIPVPGSNGSFRSLSLYDSTSLNLLIPVPSRLYSLGDKRPLAGLRTVVKDLFDVKGTKTGGGSRVYLEMYPEKNESAVAVTKLLELGAIPVKWNDVKYPWNPRGDGWLEVAFSSSGSGAAIVGYDWIDFAMGSDTGGSVRMPAALGGSYGIRPTHNAMDLTGALPQSHLFDTAGIFARNPVLFSRVSQRWYANSSVPIAKAPKVFPKNLLYPVDYLPLKNAKAQEVFDSFISTLENELGMKSEKINVTATLQKSDNPYINTVPMTESLFSTAVRWDSWRDIGKDLIARWNATYPDTGFPPFDLETRNGYINHDTVNQSAYDEVIKHKEEFATFAKKEILRPSKKTCSESIMILESGASGLPSYREEFLNHQEGAGFLYMTDPKQWLNPLLLSPLLSAPQIGIPIGQVDYKSVISLQTEKLPIVMDLMAYPGCDNMLLDLVETLAEKGVIKTVKTGRTAF
ncbi:amidase signature domain-containing protein [Fusarium solani]|uniref:Amidase signature domain-containing protein n=1 Tax=Fusarium solani TaxID=169388 RepID=A0A9P9HC76_FUSSL|nr:amidase signature domain-containing protein [Fusarium solani]KAH7254935.1 amidase signature domain-containing protein [Fusarium solani]